MKEIPNRFSLRVIVIFVRTMFSMHFMPQIIYLDVVFEDIYN